MLLPAGDYRNKCLLRGLGWLTLLQVVNLIVDELTRLRKEGFTSTAIEAAINSIEFDLRENNTGRSVLLGLLQLSDSNGRLTAECSILSTAPHSATIVPHSSFPSQGTAWRLPNVP